MDFNQFSNKYKDILNTLLINPTEEMSEILIQKLNNNSVMLQNEFEELLDKYKLYYDDKNAFNTLPECSAVTNAYITNFLSTYSGDYINKNNLELFIDAKLGCKFTNIETDPQKPIILTNDNRLQKVIITEGSGPLLQPGEEVSVLYSGLLLNNQTPFDSTSNDEPFTFILGQGQVISGWDIGISSMKKGEMSMLLLAPEYGYGSEGRPPKIPPDSGLIFFVKVI